MIQYFAKKNKKEVTSKNSLFYIYALTYLIGLVSGLLIYYLIDISVGIAQNENNSENITLIKKYPSKENVNTPPDSGQDYEYIFYELLENTVIKPGSKKNE